MKSKNEGALDAESGNADVAGPTRQKWEAPKVQPLATSTAEFSGENQTDLEGLS